MSRPLILIRPQPGNDESAVRARARGLAVVQLPFFDVAAVRGGALPAGPFDAVLLTSANAARHGAAALRTLADLPVYAVGDATASAALDAGVELVTTGGGDAESTAALIAANGLRRVLHLCGAEIRPFDPHGLEITRYIVYRATETSDEAIRPALAALDTGVVAIHSPRAGRRLAELVEPGKRARFHIAAISTAAAAACGPGWGGISVAERPDDTALLACAETLCMSGG